MVAVTGRENDRDAVEWAAAEAASRGADLRIVHFLSVPVAIDVAGLLYVERDLLRITAEADLLLAEATRRARALAPQMHVEGRVEEGPPHRTIARAGPSSAMVVVAGHGASEQPVHRSATAPRVLIDRFRSDTRASLGNLDAPVVFVNLRSEIRRPHRAAGKVVVGIDPAANPEFALRFAFDAARRRGTGLVLLRPSSCGRPNMRERGRRSVERLDVTLERCRTAFPQVQVAVQHVSERFAQAVAEHSSASALAVLGTTRTPWLRRWLFGSGYQSCLYRATGTVAVVQA